MFPREIVGCPLRTSGERSGILARRAGPASEFRRFLRIDVWSRQLRAAVFPIHCHVTHSSVGVSLVLSADLSDRLGTRVGDGGDVSKVAVKCEVSYDISGYLHRTLYPSTTHELIPVRTFPL